MENINIKAVTQLTGINENTLRAWERRYKTLAPGRDQHGRRVYSKKEIEKLIIIWSLTQKGHLIGHLAPLSLQQLKKMNEQSIEMSASTTAQNQKSEKFEQQHLDKIIGALKAFDLIKIQSSLQAARFELSPKMIITNLVLPLMQEVGKLVAESKIRISQEHLLSSLLRDHLGQIYQSLSPYEYQSKTRAKKIVLTTREGDLHEFGILLAAILCRINGHESYYLGPNMPVDDLADACEHFKIDSIIVGLASLPLEKELISTHLFLKKLDQMTSKKINILCGGNSPIDETILKSGRQFMKFSTLHDLDLHLAKLL